MSEVKGRERTERKRLEALLLDARQLMVATTPANMGGVPDLFWPRWAEFKGGDAWQHYEDRVNELCARIDRALHREGEGR